MTEQVDVLIIGAGILGCFAARNLSRYELETAVIEKNEDVCTGISKANTGIIYAGYDQHPGSLKASLCVRASKRFPELCRELDVPYKKCGLLMPAFGPKGEKVLKKKLQQAGENNAEGISLISAAEAHRKEPALEGRITQALYSESTCTVNPWELGIAAFENAADNGVQFYFGQEALKIRREKDRILVETADSRFAAKRLLICGGLHADVLWEKICRPKIRILPLAADYIVYDTYAGGLIRHVISTEPEEKGEGLTLVPTVNGNLMLGPSRRKPSADPLAATDPAGLLELKKKAHKLIPSLSEDLIIRNFATARPNPYLTDADGNLTDRSLKDFVILEENGVFDMIGVKTPGITCADELGAYIAERIAGSFERAPDKNLRFDPVRKGICRTALMDRAELESVCAHHPEYAEIVCRCRQVSKGEVQEAIRRGAVTVDGIKRRTGAGMGRCQGGYCEEKILKLLGERNSRGVYGVTKKGSDSFLIENR